MKTLFLLHGAPYGDERVYHALRLAASLAQRPDQELRVFLLGDAVLCAKAGQKVPEGYYNVGQLLARVARSAPASVGVCSTCMDARGLQDAELLPDTQRSTLAALTDATLWADKVLVY
ncbi:MAG: DsrE/DsrF/TusD sulfur relay family protein [Rhodoferax sp.]